MTPCWGNFGSDVIAGGPGNDFIDGDNPFPSPPGPLPFPPGGNDDDCAGGPGADDDRQLRNDNALDHRVGAVRHDLPHRAAGSIAEVARPAGTQEASLLVPRREGTTRRRSVEGRTRSVRRTGRPTTCRRRSLRTC